MSHWNNYWWPGLMWVGRPLRIWACLGCVCYQTVSLAWREYKKPCAVCIVTEEFPGEYFHKMFTSEIQSSAILPSPACEPYVLYKQIKGVLLSCRILLAGLWIPTECPVSALLARIGKLKPNVSWVETLWTFCCDFGYFSDCEIIGSEMVFVNTLLTAL